MRVSIKKWYIIGTVFIILVGSLLHFVYEWSGKNLIVGIFSPVNESVWEHLKMLFWSSFFFSIVEYFVIGKRYNPYIISKAISFYIGILLIIIMFYTYKGIVGNHYTIVDIIIYVVSVTISQYIGYKITKKYSIRSGVLNTISLFSIILLILSFVVFSFNPPKIPLFKDSNTNSYGIREIIK